MCTFCTYFEITMVYGIFRLMEYLLYNYIDKKTTRILPNDFYLYFRLLVRHRRFLLLVFLVQFMILLIITFFMELFFYAWNSFLFSTNRCLKFLSVFVVLLKILYHYFCCFSDFLLLFELLLPSMYVFIFEQFRSHTSFVFLPIFSLPTACFNSIFYRVWV